MRAGERATDPKEKGAAEREPHGVNGDVPQDKPSVERPAPVEVHKDRTEDE